MPPVLPAPPLGALTAWLTPLLARCGDQRTARTLTGIVAGILGSGSLVCSRIAAFPPLLAGGRYADRRVRRFVSGETAQRSDLAPAAIIAALREAGLARLRDADQLWLILDGSDLRKPHAQAMEHLQPVLPLTGKKTVPGYPTLTMLGLGGGGRRGLLDHHLSSRNANDFVSVPSITREMIRTVGAALDGWTMPITLIMDRGFDDQAILESAWAAGWRLVWRIKHRDRTVRAHPGQPPRALATVAATSLRAIGTVQADMLVRKTGQPRAKRQPVTVRLRSCPVSVPTTYIPEPGEPEEHHERACWLVEVALDRVAAEPWWLLTDHPVTTAEAAATIFRMYAQRWAIEDTFKLAKDALGQESVQVLGYEAVRTLEAFARVAVGYLFALGVGLDWEAIRFLRRLGDGEERANRPVGKPILLWGLQRLLDPLVTQALLDEARATGRGAGHGRAPPRDRRHARRFPGRLLSNVRISVVDIDTGKPEYYIACSTVHSNFPCLARNPSLEKVGVEQIYCSTIS